MTFLFYVGMCPSFSIIGVSSFCNTLVYYFSGSVLFHVYLSIQGRGGSYCEFRVRVQEDRSILLESNKYSGQHMNVGTSGKPGDPRGDISDPSRHFYVYCKVCVLSYSVGVRGNIKLFAGSVDGNRNKGLIFSSDWSLVSCIC